MFYLEWRFGSTLSDDENLRKDLKIENQTISLFWLGKKVSFQDGKFVNEIKEIFMQNINLISKYHFLQERAEGEFDLDNEIKQSFQEYFFVKIDNLSFCVSNAFDSKGLNDFYNSLRGQIESVVDKKINVL